MNVIQMMEDKRLLGQTFRRRLLRGDSWFRWKVFLRALFGLALDEEAREIFSRHTGRKDAPAQGFTEAFAIVGRRGGKSVIAALVAVFLAAFKSYDDVLAPGEVGTLMVIAADRRQARVIFGYITAFFQLPMLRSMVVSQLKEGITLNNRVTVEIHTCSFRATRGYTLIGVIADELAFWNADDSANPDREVLNALRPGLATTNGLLLGISSPYAKRGALFESFRQYYGRDDSDVLVWKASSMEMNPLLSAATVKQAYARDAAAASAEFGGEFRSDIEGFLSLEAVESLTGNEREIPPLAGLSYRAFTDVSGGVRDSFVTAVCHVEGNIAVVDCVKESPAPFDPSEVVAEHANLLRRYRVGEIEGDKYAGEWPREAFEKHGISYRPCELSKSEIYLEFLPSANARRVRLVNVPRVKSQLVGLERRTARGGRDSVDHRPGRRDDCANAVCGVTVLALRSIFGDALTLIEWEQATADGTIRAETELTPATATEEPNPPCPQCQAVCVVRLGFGGEGRVGYRCSQCSHQWWDGDAPKVVLPNRANLGEFSHRCGQQPKTFWSFLKR